jgi:hypothetical protein
MTLPAVTPLIDAIAMARDAHRRGRRQITVIIDAMNRRTIRHTVNVWIDMPGVQGWVINRFADEDGVIERLGVMVDVIDVLAANDLLQLASNEDTMPRRRGVQFTIQR